MPTRSAVEPPDRVPRRRSMLRAVLGQLGLRAFGWSVAGNFPNEKKLVVVVAPHTSNWDFVVGFAGYLALELEATWFGKHSIFWPPLGWIWRRFGGVPIDRAAAGDIVQVSIKEFGKRDQMLLALAPEGTRGPVPVWKTGFYRIAKGAGAVIVPVSLDYQSRRITIHQGLVPSGDMAADVARIRATFRAAMARYPAQYVE